ncbi:MAG TPA: hypothetical protein VNF91_02690, partial [Candidatus Acidoferrum sp.]|nr:hypothetical protein [Candidatus Acidoferrum sp.]
MSLRQLVTIFVSRRKRHLAVAFVVLANQAGFVALAAAPPSSLMLARTPHAGAPVCATGGDGAGPSQQGCASNARVDAASVSLPSGSEQCPESGPGASCATRAAAAPVTPGVASTPDGQTPCPAANDNPAPSSPAACTDVLLPATVPTGAAVTRGDSIAPPRVTPSVPVSTLRAAPPVERLELQAGSTFLRAGDRAVLVATANASITGTNNAIEIFDRTTQTLAGAC